MPRKPLIRSSDLPYHVTARSNNRELFQAGIERTWRELTHQCFEITLIYEAQIHAFVVMPNHFHLLLTTPAQDLGLVMQHFMRSATKALNRLSGRSGHQFGGRYHWSLVDTQAYFRTVFKYVHRNPVRANLCDRVEAYPYSSLTGLLGLGHLPIPIFFPYRSPGAFGVAEDVEELLPWLNRPFPHETELKIRLGLSRHTFRPPRKGWKRSPDAASIKRESDTLILPGG